jgi:hypothetical protein
MPLKFQDLFKEGNSMLSVSEPSTIENFKKEALALLKAK